MRTERDFIGEKEIDDTALYGIHSVRARENFPDNTPFHYEWYKAIGITKLACYLTYNKFKASALKKFPDKQLPVKFFSDDIINAMIKSAEEVSAGEYFSNFIIPAIQGGAGTSINMNVNEIIANSSLIKLGRPAGDYSIVDPVEHANIFQSTNDVIPTALRVAVLKLLMQLEEQINKLRLTTEQLEKKHRNHLRIGYTQMQEAVPSSYGILFSTFNEALSRDWWRVSKCFERIRVVNIGGSAIGTGIAVPRYFIMEAVKQLQQLTRLPVTRSENMPDATNNLDPITEVHAILKAHAVNLEKIVSDIRLLSSDLVRNREVEIPQRQVGSSIMPGKINPVIPEFVISAAHKVYSNDILITAMCASGCLDLNAYLPVIGNALLESVKLLISCDKTLLDNMFTGLVIHHKSASDNLYNNPSVTTALSPYIGYNQAGVLAKEMKNSKTSVFEANTKLQIIDNERLKNILKPENLLKMGFSLNEEE